MRLTEKELGDGCAEAFAGPGDNDDLVWHGLENCLVLSRGCKCEMKSVVGKGQDFRCPSHLTVM